MRSRTPLGDGWAAKKSITGIAACCARAASGPAAAAPPSEAKSLRRTM